MALVRYAFKGLLLFGTILLSSAVLPERFCVTRDEAVFFRRESFEWLIKSSRTIETDLGRHLARRGLYHPFFDLAFFKRKNRLFKRFTCLFSCFGKMAFLYPRERERETLSYPPPPPPPFVPPIFLTLFIHFKIA